jgi:hypothetical protein
LFRANLRGVEGVKIRLKEYNAFRIWGVGTGVEGREIRDGWPLLTVEIEVIGVSKIINEKGPSLVGSLGFSWRYKRFLFCLICSSRPNTKYFFPHR